MALLTIFVIGQANHTATSVGQVSVLPFIHRLGVRPRLSFANSLAPAVRYNMFTEPWGSVAYGVFFATAFQFILVVLRRRPGWIREYEYPIKHL